jgi:hypothetical protein
MLPGPDLYFACPSCNAPFRVFSLASGNTFDGERWSDGYANFPMLPSPPSISRCHQCSSFFWLADAPRIADKPYTAPPIRSLSESELNEALGTAAAIPEERERDLRLLVWHAGNHDRRNQQVYPPPPPNERRLPAFQGNLERLLQLLDGPPSRAADNGASFFDIMRVEVLRELGRFDEAKRELERLIIDRNLAAHAAVIAAGIAAEHVAPRLVR